MRSDCAHFLDIPTRWHDNDVYGHVNNVDYYAFFDTVINRWLIEEGGLDIHEGEAIGLCAESHCKFLAAVSFPDIVEAGLRVGHLGRSSVRYEIELYRKGDEEPLAEGWFVHVFVDRDERRPVGSAKVLADAYAATKRGGTTVTVGLPHPEQLLQIQAVGLVAEERTLKGSYLGSCVPRRDIPRFIELYQAGRLPVDRLLTHRIALDSLNEGFDRLARGEGVRQAVVF